MTKSTPVAVAITKEKAPKQKMRMEAGLRKLVAWVEAPTVRPMRIVTMSMSGPEAVLARRLVTPHSFSRLPKKSIPNRGRPEGTRKAVSRMHNSGKSTFSRWLTARGGRMRMRRSLGVVSRRMMGGWITGTRAI